MFFHNFKYSLKVLLKNKALIFWTIMWPIILGTMFNLAFSNLGNSSKLDIINLGIVDNNSYKEDAVLSSTLKELSNKKSKSYMFDITYGNEEQIKEKLKSKKIAGYIIKNKNTEIIVKDNGINQSIIKTVVDQIYEYQDLTSSIIKDNIETSMLSGNYPDINKIHNSVLKQINENKNYLNDLSKKTNSIVIEFYTLIAMSCLFGAMITSTVVSNYLANINKKGARITLSPTSRISLLLGGLLASFIVQLVGITLLLIYTGIILKIDYGSRLNLIIMLSFVGSLAGNSLGLLTGSIAFKNENSRVGIVLALTMFGCFLSGMMGVTMKYLVDKNIPIINKINPANMITDGFYSLYYYDKLDRYYLNIISLLIFSFILFIISYFLMRRKKYDSI